MQGPVLYNPPPFDKERSGLSQHTPKQNVKVIERHFEVLSAGEHDLA